jgi:hypothetical protein
MPRTSITTSEVNYLACVTYGPPFCVKPNKCLHKSIRKGQYKQTNEAKQINMCCILIFVPFEFARIMLRVETEMRVHCSVYWTSHVSGVFRGEYPTLHYRAFFYVTVTSTHVYIQAGRPLKSLRLSVHPSFILSPPLPFLHKCNKFYRMCRFHPVIGLEGP